MMGIRLFSKINLNSKLLSSNIPKLNNFCGALIELQEHKRQLYAKATLGIDGFNKQREFVQKQMENITVAFKEKMKEYCQNINKNMIFSEDLKNMIHLATTSEDVDLIVKMIKKFNQQNKQIRFGNYVFGPVVMRLFYIQNNPTVALECFKSPELNGFFDQMMSYQLLLDLLYENKRYLDMLDIVERIKDLQVEGQKYPRNVVVLAMAACYKMNTKESYDYAIRLWKELLDIGHSPMRRTTTFCAGLALNQGNPGVALEILTYCRNQNYTTVRNLKVAALAETGRIENIIPIFKSILTEDVHMEQKQTFNKDIIEFVQAAVAKSDNAEFITEINNILGVFQKQGNIINMTLDEQLCQEIQKPPIMNSREAMQRSNYFERRPPWQKRTNQQEFTYERQRPGLHDLV